MTQVLERSTIVGLKTQTKLNAKFGETEVAEVSPLAEELSRRGTHMPHIKIDMKWLEQAVCSDKRIDPDIFFPSNGAGVHAARKFCAKCPVRNECLEYALLNKIEQGVWGGASERQRMLILRERKEFLEEYFPSGLEAGGLETNDFESDFEVSFDSSDFSRYREREAISVERAA